MYAKRALRLRNSIVEKLKNQVLISLEKGQNSVEIRLLVEKQKRYLEYENLPNPQQLYIDGFCDGILILLEVPRGAEPVAK